MYMTNFDTYKDIVFKLKCGCELQNNGNERIFINKGCKKFNKLDMRYHRQACKGIKNSKKKNMIRIYKHWKWNCIDKDLKLIISNNIELCK